MGKRPQKSKQQGGKGLNWKKNRCMGERETKKTGKYIYGNELLNALQMCFIKVTDTSV